MFVYKFIRGDRRYICCRYEVPLVLNGFILFTSFVLRQTGNPFLKLERILWLLFHPLMYHSFVVLKPDFILHAHTLINHILTIRISLMLPINTTSRIIMSTIISVFCCDADQQSISFLIKALLLLQMNKNY